MDKQSNIPSRDEMKAKIAEMAKKADKQRQEVCEKITKAGGEDLCKMVDSVYAQYKILGFLEGELHLVDVISTLKPAELKKEHI